MEQARISTPQGTSSAQAARTRAPAQQKGVTDEGAVAQPGSFLSLLAAQDPELAEGGDPLAAMPEAPQVQTTTYRAASGAMPMIRASAPANSGTCWYDQRCARTTRCAKSCSSVAS